MYIMTYNNTPLITKDFLNSHLFTQLITTYTIQTEIILEQKQIQILSRVSITIVFKVISWSILLALQLRYQEGDVLAEKSTASLLTNT